MPFQSRVPHQPAGGTVSQRRAKNKRNQSARFATWWSAGVIRNLSKLGTHHDMAPLVGILRGGRCLLFRRNLPSTRTLRTVLLHFPFWLFVRLLYINFMFSLASFEPRRFTSQSLSKKRRKTPLVSWLGSDTDDYNTVLSSIRGEEQWMALVEDLLGGWSWKFEALSKKVSVGLWLSNVKETRWFVSSLKYFRKLI